MAAEQKPTPGFIRQKDKNFCTVRVKITAGVASPEQMSELAGIARDLGRGDVYITSRMNIEIPWIKDESQGEVVERLARVGLAPGGVGPSVRAIVACKGTTCKNGLTDTHGLARALDKALFGKKLPAKFKMRVAGCPNNCVMAKTNDLDFMGRHIPEVDHSACVMCGACKQVCPVKALSEKDGKMSIDYEKCVGCGKCSAACPQNALPAKSRVVAIFVGGKFGRRYKIGTPLPGVFPEKDVPEIAARLVSVYESGAAPKERFGDFIERTGMDKILAALKG